MGNPFTDRWLQAYNVQVYDPEGTEARVGPGGVLAGF